MNYYLIQLSYTADAWQQQIELTRDHAQRLNAVRALIARLGGSLAQYRFFEGPDAAGGGEPHSVSCKFMSIGKEDLIAMVAMPDQDAGVAFSMAVSAEPGIRDIQMTPIIPLGQAVNIMARAHEVRQQAQYSAPGGSSQTWLGAPPRPRRAARPRAPSPRTPRRRS
jgi:uncharacterized protein with GYD domain